MLKVAEKYGTPVYVYNENRIRRNYREFLLAFKSRYPATKIYYAYKVNTSLAILHILRQEGAYADVVSGGELKTALKVGLEEREIIFTNNAKTLEEIEMAADSGVIINIDSMDELTRVYEVAKAKGKTIPVSFRVNPSIDPKTHPKISTGMKESKFGIHLENDYALKAYQFAAELENIEIVGVHMHIGSQITVTEPYKEATEKLMMFVKQLKDKLDIRLDFIDLGGGLGIQYGNEKTISPDDLADAVVPVLLEWNKKLGYGFELWLEPGRYIVGNAGVLLSQVQSVKETPYKKFINLDCGFNTLLRPAMYGSVHRIENLSKKLGDKQEKYDVVGNICESGDVFAKEITLSKASVGDILAIHDAGAYGFIMGSQYNSRPRPMEVLLWEGSAELIREREEIDDLFRHQIIPEDLI